MIKFFQKLKAKKGFTLVELIVVIAIIGVLAAILIPTMLGYVTQSRVTSANSTAASLKNNIDTFLTNADTAGYGMLKSNSAATQFEINITTANNVGVWTVSVANTATTVFKTTNNMSWATGASGSKQQSKGSVKNACQLLAIELADLFPEIKTGYIAGELQGGKCVCLMYTADASVGTNLADLTGKISTTGWNSAVHTWDGSTAGVSSQGLIVGTAPVLAMGS